MHGNFNEYNFRSRQLPSQSRPYNPSFNPSMPRPGGAFLQNPYGPFQQFPPTFWSIPPYEQGPPWIPLRPGGRMINTTSSPLRQNLLPFNPVSSSTFSPSFSREEGHRRNEIALRNTYTPLLDSGGSCCSSGGTMIYIDNSNIYINTMKKSAETLNFRNDIKQDQRIRVNINKLLAKAGEGGKIIRAVLYGSEPPPIANFWNNVKECRFCKVDVQVTKKSTYSNKERDVDQNIMLDIGEDLITYRDHAVKGGTLIIFTGDGGMIAAVRRALKYGWNVEIWAYQGTLAKDYLEEAGKNEKFTIKYLDDVFSEVVFYALEWKFYVPPERSFVFTFINLRDSKMQEVLDTTVKVVTSLVKMPVSGQYLRKNEKNPKEAHLAIVCNVGKDILNEDSRTNVQNDGKITPEKKRMTSNSFHFLQEQWEQFKVALDIQSCEAGVKEEIENIIQSNLSQEKTSNENPKYDFNTQVYQKVEQIITQETHLAETIITDELKAKFTDLLVHHSPTIRSHPQYLQDISMRNFDENSVIESPGDTNISEMGYTVQVGKHKGHRKFQKYSEECKRSFRCGNGTRCTYSHSEKEKEYFKLQPEPKFRSAYKTKPCDHFNTPRDCKLRGLNSYLCPFSHGSFCLTCKCDDDGGHDLSKCPVPPATGSVPGI